MACDADRSAERTRIVGTTYTRFYNYSFLNQIRLMMQGVSEPAATYNRWVELGRQVRKGSKAKVGLAPVMVSRDAKDGNGNVVISAEGKPGKRQVLVGFRDSRTVFGFSDTDGDEVPPVALPCWDVDTALAALKVDQVPFDMVDGNVQGFSFQDDSGRHLALNPTAAYPAKTNLLLPKLTGRVVTVSSVMHRIGRISLDDINWKTRRYSAWPAYGQSKLANLLFSSELQRRQDSHRAAAPR